MNSRPGVSRGMHVPRRHPKARFLSRHLCIACFAAAHEWAESRPDASREGKSHNRCDGFS
jgi:hypothetical protein